MTTPPRQRKPRTIKARIVPPARVRLPRTPKPQPTPERPNKGQGDERRPSTASRRQPQPQPQPQPSPSPHERQVFLSPYLPPPPVVGGKVEHITVYEPEWLAIADQAEVMPLIAALTPPQRLQQALAQGVWLNAFGYPSNLDEVLTMWESWEEGRRAA